MTSFQEFLEQKAEEHHLQSRRELREDWIAAVSRLIDLIDTWLSELDPNGLLERTDFLSEKVEAGLGAYQIPSLRIELGDRSLEVVPIARKVVGSPRTLRDGAQLSGRVDITDGIKRYVLWRILKDGMESWEALDEHFGASPFDQARLESILRDLLA